MTQVEGVEVNERREGRDGAIEAVGRERDDSELGESVELGRDGAGDYSGGEDELSQLGELGD